MVQVMYNKSQNQCVAVSSTGIPSSHTGTLVCRTFPHVNNKFDFEFPFRQYKKVVYTSDEKYFVCFGFGKMKNHLYIHSTRDGALLHSLLVRYPGYKEVTRMVPLPDKPQLVALIDVEKGNLVNIVNRKFVKSIQQWDGSCTKDGK